ncbi:hypothetical protein ACFW2Y_35455, partial [Streptomyces sp. NPDC058877]|uniref:hypothetical protein n=1 Tax=Streptomyces sp. NPDC058877 TaxID=3346665 RepID=UPI0036AD82EE
APTPYDNAGLQDHNRVLKADVTPGPELTNGILLRGAGPFSPTGRRAGVSRGSGCGARTETCFHYTLVLQNFKDDGVLAMILTPDHHNDHGFRAWEAHLVELSTR